MEDYENPWGFSDKYIENMELDFNGETPLNTFGDGEAPSLEEWLNRRAWTE